MPERVILAIDQGTTGTTCSLIDTDSYRLLGAANTEFTQHYPHADWVEHDLEQIWDSFVQSLDQVLSDTGVSAEQICAIGITNQRETTCAFDRFGKPLARAIVWQDKRTASWCKDNQQHAEYIKQTTGLPLDPYFSASKMDWLVTHNETVKQASQRNELRLGTVDTFLIYRLTQGASFVTDTTNASRTLVFDIQQLAWDQKLLSLFNLQPEWLPQVKDSIDEFGTTSGLHCLPDGIPITAVLGDQQAALFGQGGIEHGDMKVTYGTGAFLLQNTGEQPLLTDDGLLTTIAFSHHGKQRYALEGACYIAGAAVQWLRDNMGFVEQSPEIEALAKSVESIEDIKELFCFPFLAGIGSPYWLAGAKGALLGLTRKTSKADIARATLEGLALAVDQLVETFAKHQSQALTTLKVDGGAANNDLLMQMQARFSKVQVVRPQILETTSYGAGVAAAIGAGLLQLADVTRFCQRDKDFMPDNQNQYYTDKKHQWQELFNKLYL